MYKAALFLGGLLLGAVLAVVGINTWVVVSTRAYVISDPGKLPQNNAGLLLGTSRYTRDGRNNPYFYTRIAAAAALYRSGKIKRLLVSGANPGPYYNEPREMYYALVHAGVPGRIITLDFAGFRTLDSIVRAKKVFGQTRFTIISQRYHDYRAVFIARHKGIDAVAYAPDATDPLSALAPVEIREYLARVRALLDLFVLNTQPRFLGPPLELKPLEPPAAPVI